MIGIGKAVKKATKAGASFSSSAISQAIKTLKNTDWEKMSRYMPRKRKERGIVAGPIEYE